MERRNHILGLWSKEASRMLPLTDCGVIAIPLVDEPPDASLVRESGTGDVATLKKEKLQDCYSSTKLPWMKKGKVPGSRA
ncbi:hypothetical protein F0562_025857 [Nyssa sinensis]|uniref:Uncharacterized protein n=1 Tax=Nyssa sinensis TaxID=561372 RepID=A0A5J5B7G0_9ASTE|nr:hypothetical protein F0562_025857 [Nyssa sinensis]